MLTFQGRLLSSSTTVYTRVHYGIPALDAVNQYASTFGITHRDSACSDAEVAITTLVGWSLGVPSDILVSNDWHAIARLYIVHGYQEPGAIVEEIRKQGMMSDSIKYYMTTATRFDNALRGLFIQPWNNLSRKLKSDIKDTLPTFEQFFSIIKQCQSSWFSKCETIDGDAYFHLGNPVRTLAQFALSTARPASIASALLYSKQAHSIALRAYSILEATSGLTSQERKMLRRLIKDKSNDIVDYWRGNKRLWSVLYQALEGYNDANAVRKRTIDCSEKRINPIIALALELLLGDTLRHCTLSWS